MGCCKSSPSDDSTSHSSLAIVNPADPSSYLTPIETMLFEKLMSILPNHCRQTIIDLPQRKVVNALQHHINAQYHFQREQYRLAILNELKAINEYQLLLPNHPDHFIFHDLYTVLRSSLLLFGLMQASIGACQLVLHILLRDKPTDYESISENYFLLYTIYKSKQMWKAAFMCVTKAIETTRLCHSPNQERIRILENGLESLERKIINDKSKSDQTVCVICEENYGINYFEH